MTPSRSIVRRAGDAYSITVDPAPTWANFDRSRPDRRAALRYAEGLRLAHGWRVVDETGETA